VKWLVMMIAAAALHLAPLAGRGRHVCAAGEGQPPKTEVHRIVLRAAVQDHFLPAPGQPHVVFRLDARAGAPKSRIMFTAPLPAGRHRMRLEVQGGQDRTFVIATPVQRGRSSFEIAVAGTGRYDFGFWAGEAGAPVKEYRFTLQGPVAHQVYDVSF